MSEKKYTIKLTNAQRGMLRALVIKEAKRLGYGSTYWDSVERSDWPYRLRRLSTIARKLMP